MKRYAIVKNARDREQLERYLPDNYRVVHEYQGSRYFEDDERPLRGDPVDTVVSFVIEGEDVAGWTFDKYVEPRLASGLIYAREIDLSHPVMKQVPADA